MQKKKKKKRHQVQAVAGSWDIQGAALPAPPLGRGGLSARAKSVRSHEELTAPFLPTDPLL